MIFIIGGTIAGIEHGDLTFLMLNKGHYASARPDRALGETDNVGGYASARIWRVSASKLTLANAKNWRGDGELDGTD